MKQPMNTIDITGARTHNLKNISLSIPRDRLTVITGLSGSGKSSLAFDTLYAEGQRRYVESLSSYARQFLDLMDKPDVDSITGLSPAISIEQKSTSHNPRSTVGTITVSVMNAMRYGVARGCFSNEAGLGSAAISAAASTTDHPARQGYISMTGTFIDTIVVCTITGLTIASSGVLGMVGADGKPLTGVALTMAAFSSNIGVIGSYIVSIGIILFAYSTILGWEYNGEKAWEYLFGTHKYNIIYRVVFSLVVYVGATQTLDLVWNLSDIANALMAIPNLISILVLAPVIKEEVFSFQAVIEKEKAAARKEALAEAEEAQKI